MYRSPMKDWVQLTMENRPSLQRANIDAHQIFTCIILSVRDVGYILLVSPGNREGVFVVTRCNQTMLGSWMLFVRTTTDHAACRHKH